MPKSKSQARPEYASPESDQSDPVWQARLQLIEATKRVVPKFLEKLATDVLPVYSRLAREGKLSKHGYDFRKALCSDDLRQILQDVLADDLKLALLRWATEFHASAPWIVLDALRSVEGWAAHADWRESRQWNTQRARSGEALPAAEPLEFRRCPGPQPTKADQARIPNAANGKPRAAQRIIEFSPRPTLDDEISERIIFEIGDTRFAIQWTAEIEQLPPAGPIAVERKQRLNSFARPK